MSAATDLKEIVSKLDINAPRIDVVDWKIFDDIINNHDFTKCDNTLEVMKKFYTYLWTSILFPMEDELNLKDRENGRLIIEWHEQKCKAERLEKELESLREDVQEPCPEGAPSK